MQDLLELFGIDFFSIIWNFVESAVAFFGTLLTSVSVFIGYLYHFNPIIAVIFVLGVSFGIFFGLLKLIKLIPFL